MTDALHNIRNLTLGLQVESSSYDTRQPKFAKIIAICDS
jgi:hypothetical protein